MSGTSLEIDKLSVAYDKGVRVLRQLSLSVEPGEFVALLGSSGCGKTTLLRAVCGFVPVTAGTISVAGRDITQLPPERRDMAMVFQSYALWPHMNVAQNIAYGLKLRRRAPAAVQQRVTEILDILGLEGLGGRRIDQLSGGQRQRVALGRALAIDPRLLLLDEPLSNLDARIRQAVRHEIKALQEQLGITALHVTHDREEAMVMADRIVILDGGDIAQQGSPEAVYKRPASPFVATFMGADNEVSVAANEIGGALRIAAGAHNDAVDLPMTRDPAADGVFLSAGVAPRMRAHFRSVAARLLTAPTAPEHALVLRGKIAQASYPGGFYRYAVAVGEQRFMVDDERRLNTGTAVGICVPATKLHLYPEPD